MVQEGKSQHLYDGEKSRQRRGRERERKSGTNRIIFQSSREAPGGGTAARPIWARPSVLTQVLAFSV
jgi:hypothetical protein